VCALCSSLHHGCFLIAQLAVVLRVHSAELCDWQGWPAQRASRLTVSRPSRWPSGGAQRRSMKPPTPRRQPSCMLGRPSRWQPTRSRRCGRQGSASWVGRLWGRRVGGGGRERLAAAVATARGRGAAAGLSLHLSGLGPLKWVWAGLFGWGVVKLPARPAPLSPYSTPPPPHPTPRCSAGPHGAPAERGRGPAAAVRRAGGAADRGAACGDAATGALLTLFASVMRL
jgi:hypothetical protein